jgi:hypothetical protein
MNEPLKQNRPPSPQAGGNQNALLVGWENILTRLLKSVSI